jgi:hypothetical protein
MGDCGMTNKMKYDIEVEDTKDSFITKALEKTSGPLRGWKFNRYADGRKEIEWFDLAEGLEPIPYAEVMRVADELKAEFDLIKYQFDRQKAYPELADQLDALFKYFKSEGVENEFTQMIQEVKDQYPKP